MPQVSFSSSFRRAFKRRIKGNAALEARFWQKVERLTVNPLDQSLKTHKLSGKLKDLWSFSVDYDERVLFYFTENGNVVLSILAATTRCIESSQSPRLKLHRRQKTQHQLFEL